MVDIKKFFSGIDFFNATEEEIIRNKKEGRVYVADFKEGRGKYISTVFDSDSDPYDISLKISPRIEVRITYTAHDDTITGVKLAKLDRNNELQKMHLSTLDFNGILAILQLFSGLDLKAIANRSIILDANVVQNEDELRKLINTILADSNGLKILAEVASAKGILAEGDIGNVSKKKEALKEFGRLLIDDNYFESKQKEMKFLRGEDLWQFFFESNKWIFGYGLEYIFNAAISKERFQQTLQGSSFAKPGKRPDGILKTLGSIQFLNIIEIKTHITALLKQRKYRTSNVWQISDELAGAVSQSQQYVRTSARNLDETIQLKDKEGNRTGEEVFSFHPKCFLIVGSMKKEFLDDDDRVLNTDKLSCFESFRKNILIPEIITFDQLYYRARYIIESHT